MYPVLSNRKTQDKEEKKTEHSRLHQGKPKKTNALLDVEVGHWRRADHIYLVGWRGEEAWALEGGLFEARGPETQRGQVMIQEMGGP